MSIERINLYRLKVPLRAPYRLSIAEIEAFDTVLVQMRDRDGRSGLGEATVLTGYTHETLARSWKLACELASQTVSQPLTTAKDTIGRLSREAPFTVTALTTAIEMLEGSPYLRIGEPARVPLLALVQGTGGDQLTTEIDALITRGYGTLKIKVGFDVDADLKRVRLIQRLVDGRARLRIDANQGYDRESACRFAKSLDPEGIELLEQTCRAGDWEAAQAVARVSSVALMLDESIYDLSDIDKAAELGVARYIKFKLMKAGSLERLAHAIEHIRDRGMEPVLGNGVACDVGCWMEACLVPGHIHNAGEMNGFLKTSDSLLAPSLVMEQDAIRLDPGFIPKLDDAVIAKYSDASETFTAR